MSMALASKGPDWQDWVLHNLARNCSPRDMLERMVKAGWESDTAARALDEGLAQLQKPLLTRPTRPHIDTARNVIDCGDLVAKVLVTVQRPRIVYLDHILRPEECDALIAFAEQKGLRKSAVVDAQSGDHVDHHARSSHGTFFARGEHDDATRIERRLARLTQWPEDHAEGLQILRYEVGQEYRPHFDWFDANNPGSAKHLERGGQRLATFVLYLTDVEAGGGTIFPTLGLEVFPRRGAGVFFADVDEWGRPDSATLHGGSPVITGTKIIATYWQRERRYGS